MQEQEIMLLKLVRLQTYYHILDESEKLTT
jgi:hypothetical protein